MIQFEVDTGLHTFKNLPIFALMAYYQKNTWIDLEGDHACFSTGTSTAFLLSQSEYAKLKNQGRPSDFGCTHPE